ncbi:hypothetical protein EGW08_014713 [Elysia chlorotica]|uniref:Uncharacterized protein n=1 Tax=Elysia chlorotica TaxID=188477 RepID=A0A3S1B709_ELYCH|nr:hypothetical protein EGW08_014713 [Elysia chlorotica]
MLISRSTWRRDPVDADTKKMGKTWREVEKAAKDRGLWMTIASGPCFLWSDRHNMGWGWNQIHKLNIFLNVTDSITSTPDLSATDLSATDLSATDPSATDLSATGPSATNPSVADSNERSNNSRNNALSLCICTCPDISANTSIHSHRTLTDIRRRLFIDTTHLSSRLRRLSCAEDQRTSCVSMGTSAVFLLVAAISVIVVFDMKEKSKCMLLRKRT